MDSSVSRVGAGEGSLQIPPRTSPGELYGFVIVIILRIGGLARTEAAGYFHVGSLSTMAQIDAIVMMAIGGGRRAILYRAVIVRDPISSIDTQGGLVYGPEAWPVLGQKWGCALEILDEVPEVPQGDVAEGRIRLYIPKRVKVNGEEKDFTLNSLIEMGGGPFEYCSPDLKDQFGDNTASGWIEIDRNVIPSSREKNYETKKEMVEKEGCRMPRVLEAVVLNLMVFAFTDERLYGDDPLTYTCCFEKVDGKHPACVGDFNSEGLNATHSYVDYYEDGVAGVSDL